MRKHLIISSLTSLSLLVLTVCSGCGGGGDNNGNSGNTPPSSTATTISGMQSIAFTVENGQGSVGDTISIPVTMENNSTARAVSCTIIYDSATIGPGDNGSTSIRDGKASVGSGIASRRKWANGGVTLYFVSGSTAQTRTIATIPFKALKTGTTKLTVNNVTAYSDNMQPVQADIKKTNGLITTVK